MKIFEKVFKGKNKDKRLENNNFEDFTSLYINIFILFQVKVAMVHSENNKNKRYFR